MSFHLIYHSRPAYFGWNGEIGALALRLEGANGKGGDEEGEGGEVVVYPVRVFLVSCGMPVHVARSM